MYSHSASGKQKNPMTYGYNSTHHRTIFILINFLMSNLQCVLFYINNIMYKASHLIIFVSFFTHFKWSKPGLSSTFPLYQTAEKSSKIKHFKHFINPLPVDCVICPLYVLNHLMIYFVPLPFPSTAITPFFSIAFSNCVVFDLPNGTYGAISLIGFSIVLLKNL